MTLIVAHSVTPSQESGILSLDDAVAMLTPIQLHVLVKAGYHRWHPDAIPFIPGTQHQKMAALSLTTPQIKLLAQDKQSTRPVYRLTRRGEQVVLGFLPHLKQSRSYCRSRLHLV